MRPIRSSPSRWATRTVTPSLSAISLTRSAQPDGLSPPALLTTLMPRSTHVPSTCSIWVRNVVAYPPSALRALAFHRMSIVSSASQSPVSTSMGPPSTISLAADTRSP